MSARSATLGNRLAPPRFVAFIAVLAAIWSAACLARGWAWDDGLVLAFDVAGLLFIASLLPFLRDHTAAQIRRHAAENDANRDWVLGLTGLVTVAILAAIHGDLAPAQHGDMRSVLLLVGTLALAWCYINVVFALHYAHAFYAAPSGKPANHGGFDFPGTPEPDYADFLYFAFTAGMSFAASDVNVTSSKVRRVVVGHCLLSFVFNIGVLAFSINVLAGAAGH